MSIYTTTEGGGLFVSTLEDCHGTPASREVLLLATALILPLATAPSCIYRFYSPYSR